MRVVTGPARWILFSTAVLTGLVGCAEDGADDDAGGDPVDTAQVDGAGEIPSELQDALDDVGVDLEDAPDNDLAPLDPCELLTPEEAAIYVGTIDEHGPSFMDEPPNWQCYWWDESIDGFDILVMHYDNWDFSFYDDPEWGMEVVPFDDFSTEAVLLRPNDVLLVEESDVHPDQVLNLWARKSGYTFQFTGRQWDDSLRLGSTEFENFLEVAEIAMSRVP